VKDDVGALRTLAQKATPGDWRYHPPFAASEQSYAALGTVHQCSTMYVIADIRNWRGVLGPDYTDANGRYLAACSPDVILALLARLDAAEAVARMAAAGFDPSMDDPALEYAIRRWREASR
jgi:hypothetical protein